MNKHELKSLLENIYYTLTEDQEWHPPLQQEPSWHPPLLPPDERGRWRSPDGYNPDDIDGDGFDLDDWIRSTQPPNITRPSTTDQVPPGPPPMPPGLPPQVTPKWWANYFRVGRLQPLVGPPTPEWLLLNDQLERWMQQQRDLQPLPGNDGPLA